jgi:hypothetical protein
MNPKRTRRHQTLESVLAIAIGTLALTPVFAADVPELRLPGVPAPAIPIPSISQFSYTIDPRDLPEGYVRLGDGVNMLDPDEPVLSTKRAFGHDNVVEARSGASDAELGEWAHFQVADSSVFRQSMDEEEEAKVLEGYFKASYGLVSGEAALEQTKSESNAHKSFYVLIEHEGNTQRVNTRNLEWNWKEKPRSESMSGDAEVLAQFLGDYGSHYVSTITYGLRIGIRATLSENQSENADAFSASLKGKIGKLSAEGGMSATDVTEMEKFQADLVMEVTSGGMEPPRPLVLTGWNDIFAFLDDLVTRDEKGEPKLKFRLAPISANLKSYWSTLPTNWVKTRAALRPVEVFAVAASPSPHSERGTN